MSNQAYLSIWSKDFTEPRILEQFGALLATVPFSATAPGFSYLVIRAVDATESPVLEQDLRAVPLDADAVIEIAKNHLNSDCAYEVRSHWDLWTFEDAAARWQIQPQPLELFAHGEDYDEGFWREFGHLQVEPRLRTLLHRTRRPTRLPAGRQGEPGKPGGSAVSGSHGTS